MASCSTKTVDVTSDSSSSEANRMLEVEELNEVKGEANVVKSEQPGVSNPPRPPLSDSDSSEDPESSGVDEEEVEVIQQKAEAMIPGRKKRFGNNRRTKTPQICDECGKTVLDLPRHKSFNHKPKQTCPQCPYQYTSGRNFWRHFSKNHKGLDLPTFTTPYSKARTQDTITPATLINTEILICQACNQEFSSEVSFRRHHYFAHGKGVDPDNHLRCEQCFKSFKQKATLDDHIRRAHEGKGHFCDLCTSRGDLQSAAKLWRHKVDRHGMTDLEPPPGVNIIQCEFCGEKMFRGLDSHVKKSHPEEYPEFKSRLPLITVKVTNEPESNEVNLKPIRDGNAIHFTVQCPHCSKEIQPSSLKRHLRNVHGVGDVRRFPCPECGKEFKERYTMTDHMKETHDEVQKFLDSGNLVQRKMENGKEAYYCNLCDYQCSNKFQARAHLSADHPSEYTSLEEGIVFECFECGEKFKKEGELRTHVSTSHPDSCWKCPICWKVMLSPEEFSTHFDTEHNPAPPKPEQQKPKRPRSQVLINSEEIRKMRFCCEICSKNLALHSFQQHYFRRHGITLNRKFCESCEAEFSKLEFWVGHLCNVHDMQVEEAFADGCKLDEEQKAQMKAKEQVEEPKKPKQSKLSSKPMWAKRKYTRAPKSRKFDSDAEQNKSRKSGRIKKRNKVDLRSLASSGSESEMRKKKRKNKYCLPAGLKLSDLKSCHVSLVRLTNSQIREYTSPVKIVKIEKFEVFQGQFNFD